MQPRTVPVIALIVPTNRFRQPSRRLAAPLKDFANDWHAITTPHQRGITAAPIFSAFQASGARLTIEIYGLQKRIPYFKHGYLACRT